MSMIGLMSTEKLVLPRCMDDRSSYNLIRHQRRFLQHSRNSHFFLLFSSINSSSQSPKQLPTFLLVFSSFPSFQDPIFFFPALLLFGVVLLPSQVINPSLQFPPFFFSCAFSCVDLFVIFFFSLFVCFLKIPFSKSLFWEIACFVFDFLHKLPIHG